jgi:hypothetical protein
MTNYIPLFCAWIKKHLVQSNVFIIAYVFTYFINRLIESFNITEAFYGEAMFLKKSRNFISDVSPSGGFCKRVPIRHIFFLFDFY